MPPADRHTMSPKSKPTTAKDQREMASAFTSAGVTDAERARLDFFAHNEGKCSACNDCPVRTAHLGIKGKANVGLCGACLTGLANAMKDGPNV